MGTGANAGVSARRPRAAVYRVLGLAMAGLMLVGCADLPPSFRRPPPPPTPLTLPAADGRAAQVMIGDGFKYVVNYQSAARARGGVFLRITRASAPELGYADGLTAKRAAEAYCADYNRALNPVAFGQFSLPASWMFEGGCG